MGTVCFSIGHRTGTVRALRGHCVGTYDLPHRMASEGPAEENGMGQRHSSREMLRLFEEDGVGLRPCQENDDNMIRNKQRMQTR